MDENEMTYEEPMEEIVEEAADEVLSGYALALAEDGRIQWVSEARFGGSESIYVDSLSEGNAQDYRYVDGEYVYDPLPIEEEKLTPTELERFEAQLLYTALMTDTLLEAEE